MRSFHAINVHLVTQVKRQFVLPKNASEQVRRMGEIDVMIYSNQVL